MNIENIVLIVAKCIVNRDFDFMEATAEMY